MILIEVSETRQNRMYQTTIYEKYYKIFLVSGQNSFEKYTIVILCRVFEIMFDLLPNSRIHAFKHSRILPQRNKHTPGNKGNNPPDIGIARINVNVVGDRRIASFFNFELPDEHSIDKHSKQ